jgi:pimeloyl-ACP methyl ester carboxylesterase
MKFSIILLADLAILFGCLSSIVQAQTSPSAARVSNVYPMQEGFVDSDGLMIYYMTVGRGDPLLIVHGGPGASHDYFLPYLLPLARTHKFIFIDERGSGRSQKLEDPSGYTIENMVEDVEAVRLALGLGKITLLGHSYGGALAQAYALKYQKNLSHLILASTWSSSTDMNEIFVRMKQNMTPELRGPHRQTRGRRALWPWQGLSEKSLPGRLYGRGLGRRLLSLRLPESARPQLRPDCARNYGVGFVPPNVGRTRRIHHRRQFEVGGVHRSSDEHQDPNPDSGRRSR